MSHKSYNRLAVQTRPTFVLKFFSYGQVNGPLIYDPTNLKAHLSYSVRDIPSPPAQLRKTHTGLTSRCRKEVITGKAAQAKLDQITEAITSRMEELEEERSREPSPEPEQILAGPEPPREFVVDIKCEEGRHRSVAFVEELSRSRAIKRKGWDIQVRHRDLGDIDFEEAQEVDEEEGEAGDDVVDDMDVVVRTPSSGHPDKSMRKRMDKRMKKMRSASIHDMIDGE